MLVNQETKVTTEIVGVNIFLNVEEAKTLQYILCKYHEDFMCIKKREFPFYMVQANFLSEDLSREIGYKILGGK